MTIVEFAKIADLSTATISGFFSFLLRMIVALGCLELVSGYSALAEPPVWINVTNDLGGDASKGSLSTLTLGVAPGTDTVYAHIGRVGLFASKDGGAHWTNLVTPPETSPINGFVGRFLFDPKDPKTFWIACWYGKGLLKTTDAGKTFWQLGTQDKFEGVSVDFTDPERKTIVIGRHEMPQSLMISKDAGATWKTIGTNLPPDTNFTSSPLLIGPNTILTNTSGFRKGLVCGIWRSEDAGETWTKVSDYSPTGAPLLSSKGIVFWSVGGGLARSSDTGKTWELLKSPTVGSIIELPDGRLVGKGQHRIAISNDGGDSWTEYGPELPVKPSGFGQSIVYLPGMKAFLICASSYQKINPDAIWRLNAP